MLESITVNYWHAIVAAIAAFVIGALWYGPLFGKTWMKLAGVTMKKTKSAKKMAMRSMGIGFLLTIVTSITLANVLGFAQASTMKDAAQVAFWLWLGFAVPIEAGIVLWEGKPFALFVLNALHYLVSFLVMATIIVAWV